MKTRIVSALIAIVGLPFSAHTFAAQGKTPGQFGVSPWGSAQYTIPIWAAPGPRGVQPHVSLSYDSAASYGPVGVGWWINGLGAITRCNKTVAQDGVASPVSLTVGDAYCVNGNRLRLTSASGTYGFDGSTYQTEIADFSQITLHGNAQGPNPYFTVQARDGLTYQYGFVDSNGNGANSQAFAGTGIVATWYLSKVIDRSGNNYVVNYLSQTAESVPDKILWTPVSSGASTYTYTMQFKYSLTPLPSAPVKYVAGTAVTSTSRLSTIAISNGANLVKEYFLQYGASPATGRSELTTITECADAAQTNCLNPTTVGYTTTAAGTFSSDTVTSLSGIFETRYDFNGDGIPDLVYVGTTDYFVSFGSASGYSAGVDTGIPKNANALFGNLANGSEDGILANNGGTWFYYTYNGTSFAGVSTGLAYVSMSYTLADINGDGRLDLIGQQTVTTETMTRSAVVAPNSANPNNCPGGCLTPTYANTETIYVRLNTTTGSVPSFSSTQTVGATFSQSGMKTLGGGTLMPPNYTFGKLRKYDFNGDGLDDLVMNIQTSDTNSTVYELISNGSSFTPISISVQSPGTNPIYFINWNDDACTDMVIKGTLYIAGCNGAAPSTAVVGQVVGEMDWDGDGRTDLLVANGATLGVYLSQGNNTLTLTNTSIPYNPNFLYFRLDTTGTGRDDLGVNTVPSLAYYVHNGSLDLATSFTDGYGVSDAPHYVPFSASGGAYTKGSALSLPFANYDSLRAGPNEPIQIVDSCSSSDGIGGRYTTSFQYTQAVTNVQGRGFQGFAQIRRSDSRTGIIDYKNSSVTAAFPQTAALTSESTTQSNGTNISVYTATVTTVNQDATPNNQRYFVYKDTEKTVSYEVQVGGTYDGKQISTRLLTRASPDAYGNFATVTTSLSDDDTGSLYSGTVWTTKVATTISPSAATWCNSLPTEVDVTNSATGQTDRIRHTGFTPDYTACRETASVDESGNTLYQVNTGYSYDAFGNVNAQTVTGINMAPRTTTIVWGTTGQFPVSTTNAIFPASSPSAQTTQFTYDSNFGGLLSITDPNHIVASFSPDAFGRPMKETLPDQTSIASSYAACSACDPSARLMVTHQKLDTAGHVITSSYDYFDMFNRQLSHQDTLLNGSLSWTSIRHFDNQGRIASSDFPYVAGGTAPGSQSFSYDILGRPVLIQRPVSATNPALQSSSILYQGRSTVVTDALSHAKTTYTKVTGAVGRVKDITGYYINFVHDVYGDVTSVTDSAANTLQTIGYGYGVKPFQTSMTDMDLGSQTWVIDALGEATSHTDAKGQSFSAVYDALSRMTSRTEPDMTSTWTWGTTAASFNIGKLASVSSTATSGGTHSETFSYDSVGRISDHTTTSPTDGSRSFDYQYSSVTGLPSTLTYPTSAAPAGFRLAADYSYQNGVLQKITDHAAPTTVWWQANSTNARGQITQETAEDLAGHPQIVSNRTYDAVTGWISGIQSGVSSGAALQNEAFLFDEMGNLSERQDNNRGLTEDFHYDGLYRLSTSQLNGSLNLSITYDVNGNIKSRSDVASGGAWTYDPTHKHQVTQAGSASLTYAYDANGNAISRNGSLISWTSYNYPSGLSTSTESATFDYGADRQRWRMVYSGSSGLETTYYSSPLFEAVYTSAGTDYRHYIYAGDRPVMVISHTSAGAINVHTLLTNHQGSISTIVADATGTSSAAESFTPFGNRREASNWSIAAPTAGERSAMDGVTREGYTFQTVLGSMGLNHMNGRVEDAVTGRFLSADVHTGDPFGTQDWNRYSYVNNNPTSFTDPSGFLRDPLYACYGSGCSDAAGFGGFENVSTSIGIGFTSTTTYTDGGLLNPPDSGPPAQQGDTSSAGNGSWQPNSNTVGDSIAGQANSVQAQSQTPQSQTSSDGLDEIVVTANPTSPPVGTPTPPPKNIPGGPWQWYPDDQNPRGGTWKGPKDPVTGRRVSATQAPDGGYWKTNDGSGNSQRYSADGTTPLTPEQAHPGNPAPNVGPTGPIAIILCALFFCANPAY